MSTEVFIIGAIAILVVLGAAALWLGARQGLSRRERSGELREQFGTEYLRTLAEKGDARSTDRELTARQKRVSSFDIKTLDADQGRKFSDEWLAIKTGFVDDPSTAISAAESLLSRVMDARGYPAGDFEQRSADVSVDHAFALQHFRAAHEIALRDARGESNTEELRQAVLNDHELFAELVGEPVAVAVEAPADEAPADVEVEPEATPVTAEVAPVSKKRTAVAVK